MLLEAGVEDHDRVRESVLDFVDERIAQMPTHTYAGIVVTERILGLLGGSRSEAALSRAIRRWSQSRLFPTVQYVRLIRSLVLLSAHEFAEERETAGRW